MIKQMIEWECPDCGSEIKLYNTHPNGKEGRYKCTKCGRNTCWKVGKSISTNELIEQMKNKIKGKTK